jgi:lysophospholipase L1-like esterase
VLRILIIVFIVLAGFVLVELLLLKYNGKPVPAPQVSSDPVKIGSGEAVTFVVLGDSTSVGQGGEYAQGIAMAMTNQLASKRAVTMVNVGVSGARAKGVADKQLPKVTGYKPDIALVAVGANDVTHLTNVGDVEAAMRIIIDGLIAANCNIRIVLTGSPGMGSIPRIPQPLRHFVGVRTKQMNVMFDRLTKEYGLTRAPIAEQTGPIFAKDSTLFAEDKFHPNDRGYALWNEVLAASLNEAMTSQPSHCAK